jgi:hypothetical protein
MIRVRCTPAPSTVAIPGRDCVTRREEIETIEGPDDEEPARQARSVEAPRAPVAWRS